MAARDNIRRNAPSICASISLRIHLPKGSGTHPKYCFWCLRPSSSDRVYTRTWTLAETKYRCPAYGTPYRTSCFTRFPTIHYRARQTSPIHCISQITSFSRSRPRYWIRTHRDYSRTENRRIQQGAFRLCESCYYFQAYLWSDGGSVHECCCRG